MYWHMQTFEGSNLQMLNATTEIFVIKRIGNLYNPYHLREKAKVNL